MDISKSAVIQTVLGPVAASELGRCQIHEHIFVDPTPASEKNPALCIDDMERSASELRKYGEAGGGAIADAQPVYAGRNAQALIRLSRRSKVHIVASTGYHLRNFYRDDEGLGDFEELYGLYVSELREGMLDGCGGRTEARAGLVKSAIPAEGPVGTYRTQLMAAAAAAHDCGTALMMHTEAGKCAVEAVQLCMEQGLEGGDIIVCHADRQTADRGVHRALAELGVFMEYDTIARPKYHSDAEEIELILYMLSRGFEKQLLFSLDTTRSRLAEYGGAIGMTYLIKEFLPALSRSGVSEDVLKRITVYNPARALSLRNR